MAHTQAKLLLLLAFGGCCQIAFIASAQPPVVKKISLQDAMTIALAKNTSLKISEAEAQAANANYRQTNAVFLPSIELNYTALSTNNPLNVFGFKLQQERVTAEDFNPALLNNPAHAEDYSAKIEVQQPLLNPDLWFQRRAAKKQKEAYEYKYRRTSQLVEFETRKSYLNLQLAYKSVAIVQESLAKAKEIAGSTQRFFEQGLLKKSDILNAQVQVATLESQLAKANSMVLNASEDLALMIEASRNTVFETDSLQTDNKAELAAIETVSPARPDLMAMKSAAAASSLMVKSEQMSLLPRVNAFGSFQYNDPSFAQFDAHSYLVGVKFSWTLFNGTKNYHAIRSRKAEQTKLELELKRQQDLSQAELDKARRDRMEMLAEINRQNASVNQAAEALRILQNRYDQGLVPTSDLLAAQMQLLQQKMGLAQAVYGNNLTLAYLQFLTTK